MEVRWNAYTILVEKKTFENEHLEDRESEGRKTFR
jgi:hypothetical protein